MTAYGGQREDSKGALLVNMTYVIFTVQVAYRGEAEEPYPILPQSFYQIFR